MANTFLTPSVVAREALMVLENNLVMANLVHRDYSDEFVQVGDTVTIRKPAKFTAKNFAGAIVRQDASEGSVAVKIDRHRDVSFEVTSKEMTLDIKDFSSQLIAPGHAGHRPGGGRGPSQRVRQHRRLRPGHRRSFRSGGSGRPGQDPGRGHGPPGSAQTGALHRTQIPLCPHRQSLEGGLRGQRGDLRNAELGRVYTLDTYMDQNCPDSLSAAPGTAGAYQVTGTAGATVVALTGVSAATATVKKGDCFILDGYRYHFTEDKTAVSGAVAQVGIDCELVKDYTNADAYVVSKPHSLPSTATPSPWSPAPWPCPWGTTGPPSSAATAWASGWCTATTRIRKRTPYPWTSSTASRPWTTPWR